MWKTLLVFPVLIAGCTENSEKEEERGTGEEEGSDDSGLPAPASASPLLQGGVWSGPTGCALGELQDRCRPGISSGPVRGSC